MKRIILFIVLLLFTATNFAQETSELALGKDFQGAFTEGLKLFLSFLNFVYIIVFILTAWLINDTADSVNNSTQWFSWFGKIPKVLRCLIVGIIYIIFFYWGFKYHTRLDIVALVFSMLFSMVLYKTGINKLLRLISTKWFGLKFSEDTEEQTKTDQGNGITA